MAAPTVATAYVVVAQNSRKWAECDNAALSAALEAAAKRLGHRSIMGVRWQSWGGFTSRLYSGDRRRGEFDEATFVFLPGFVPAPEDDVAANQAKAFERCDSLDKESLTSGYFGRPIKRSEFTFCASSALAPPLTDDKKSVADWAERALAAIHKTALPDLYIQGRAQSRVHSSACVGSLGAAWSRRSHSCAARILLVGAQP